MIERLIENNISFFKKYNYCDEEQIAVYRYALQILYTYLIDVSVLLFISWIFGKLHETLIMIALFALLQVFGGGYHADNKLKCFCIMFFGCLTGWNLIELLSKYNIIIIFIILAITYVIILLIAPIKNRNHPVTKKVYKRSKLVLRVILSIILVLIFILTICRKEIEVMTISITLFLYTCSLLRAYFNENIIIKKQL